MFLLCCLTTFLEIREQRQPPGGVYPGRVRGLCVLPALGGVGHVLHHQLLTRLE